MIEPDVVFRAMADRTRHRALALLIGHELSVSELVEVLQQPQSTVSRHLKVLRDAGLIHDRRNGTTVLYSAGDSDPSANGSELVARLLEWIARQPVPSAQAQRLKAVMRRRREMSDAFFHEIGRHWDALREESFGSTFHVEALLALLPSNWTVADIGAGTGYLLPVLARHFDRVVAVDPVHTMLDAARFRLEEAGAKNVDLRLGSLTELPIATASVDVAVAILVLHHVPSPAGATAELARIVRPGGRVLIVELAAHVSDTFRERMQDRWWGLEPDQCRQWLRKAGIGSIATRPLTTVEQAADAPELYAIVGCKDSNG